MCSLPSKAASACASDSLWSPTGQNFGMDSKRKRKEVSQKPTNPCETCRSMTSTLMGLQALVSDEGYAHLSKTAIVKSARRGCAMCRIFRSYRWSAEPEGDGRLRVFAEIDNSETWDKNAQFEHPFRNSKIKRLLVNKRPGQEIYRFEMCVFTTASESSLIQKFLSTCLMLQKTIQPHSFLMFCLYRSLL